MKDRGHMTKYGGWISGILYINASVFQGSGFGSTAFTVNASDLKTLYSNNLLSKYADDMYLIVGSSRHDDIPAELDHISNWAASNK